MTEHTRSATPARTQGTRSVAAIVTVLLFLGAPATAARQEIDTARSVITVRVLKSGLFRVFGDNHEVRAPIGGGWVDEGDPEGVQITVDTRQMTVLDPNLSPSDRDQVQTRMLSSDVLDANRFPVIRFESTSVDDERSGAWTVTGKLTLHGETHPVTMRVSRENGHYKGAVSFKQTAFGITPITVAAGTVKVKDEVTIEFDIVTRSSRTTQR